jgi:serine/threonine-protein kinase
MGVVVVAHHLALDKRVAIKLMRPELRVDRDLVRRFLREARAAARLNSRHIAHVFDVGTLEDGAPYIVMEYLDGMNLAAWLRQRGPAPVPLAAAMLSQVSDAIAEAHAIGIIHRDLKPANLFVTHDSDGESRVKVLDLGICKLVERTDDLPDTSVATALGTPAYMAPEQLGTARHADTRSDIWSLGVILYELVTGRVPFHGQTPAELHACAYPRMNCAEVTSDFEAIVARCLAKDPAKRFQSVSDLAAALAPFARGTVAGTSVPLAGRTRRLSRRWTASSVTVAAFAIAGVLGLGSSVRGEGSPLQLRGWPQPVAPAFVPSPQISSQIPLVPAPEDRVRSHVEPAPAAPTPARPSSTGPGARTARALRSPLHTPVERSPAPPLALDPLSTPY